ncbi:acid phosphatase [Planctomycetales bacterium ZRK34]|nr:acid phosphatase [Planctomycetales bacterium ZRK34]
MPVEESNVNIPVRGGWSRRRMLKTLFCSSAVMALNLDPRMLRAGELADGDLHFLAIGDFGSQAPPQAQVARAMIKYVDLLDRTPDGLLLLGDNFYGRVIGGVKSGRWQTGFEMMYPASTFPNPCPVVLGNHDYRDTPGGDKMQLEYAKKPGTRWTMPHRWYRRDYNGADGKPLMTLLCIDTNLPSVKNALGGRKEHWPTLTPEQEAEQWDWIKQQLDSDRAPWTIVMGHHPVYSNGAHRDTKRLVEKLGPQLEAHGVQLYLCGHDHDMQHLELEGLHTSFVVSGGGGQSLREPKVNERSRFARDVYGFTHLAIGPKRMVVRHIDIDGKQIHAFTKYPDGQFEIQSD